VLTVPTAVLYASVDGAPGHAAWVGFAAFTAAIFGLLALGCLAVRGARRLAVATESARSASELADERLHDPLTGLANRTLFAARAEHGEPRARRPAARAAGQGGAAQLAAPG
jgi:hypothetical protein